MNRNLFIACMAVIAVSVGFYFFVLDTPLDERISTVNKPRLESPQVVEKTAISTGSSGADFASDRGSHVSEKPIEHDPSPVFARKKAESGNDGNGYVELPDETAHLWQMDTGSLVSLICDTESQENTRHLALGIVLDRLHEDKDQEGALQMLNDMKAAVQGEDQQFVLKALHDFAEEGGNEAIVDTFFESTSDTNTVDRFRMLTYLDPKYPLSERTTDRLANAYLGLEEELRPVLLDTLATACGDWGVSWIIDLLNEEEQGAEWDMMVSYLGRSGSHLSLDYLNHLLNNLSDSDADEENKEQVRQAILQLKDNLVE